MLQQHAIACFILRINLLFRFCKQIKSLFNMKRLVFLLFLILFVLLQPSQHILYSLPFHSDSFLCPVDTIPIRESTGGGGWEGNDPNGIPFIPIGCEFDTSGNSISFFFYDDLGIVSITVSNLFNNEVETRIYDSQLGIVSFPISGNSGFYSIHIITAGGNHYYGQFII